MIRSRVPATFAAALLLGHGAFAQQPAEDPNQPPRETTSTSPGPSAASRGADTDPFDYEASEQISEDLSVSFPVDI